MNREEIERELTELRKLRQSIDERILFFERQRDLRHDVKDYLGRNGKMYVGVSGTDLKPYIQEWIDRGYTLGALADRCVLHEETLRKIMNHPNRMIRITTADAILQALELPHIFNQLVPDPPEDYHYQED